MYLIERAAEMQNANVIFCSDAELAVIRELITRADDHFPEWCSIDDTRVIMSINQALNKES